MAYLESVGEGSGDTYYFHGSGQVKLASGADSLAARKDADLLQRTIHEKYTETATLAYHSKLDRFVQDFRNILYQRLLQFPDDDQRKHVFATMKTAIDGTMVDDGETGRTSLHYMAMNVVTDLLEPLVAAEFQMNQPDSDGPTPLHLAVIGNHLQAVETLVERCHADVHLADHCNAQPWHEAIEIDVHEGQSNARAFASKVGTLRLISKHV